MSVDALVLMYHAVPTGRSSCAAADPHYSVDRSRFVDQLGLMSRMGLKPTSVREILKRPAGSHSAPGVALTFDDGHETNFAAFEDIVRMGGTADFFVNPGTVGTAGYLSWSQLREMDRLGASIQSHGMHHVGLDDLTAQGLEESLQGSRECIEDELGRAVELFAPPFGRTVPALTDRARHAGYQALCSSRVGYWRDVQSFEIPRFAVRATTSNASLAAWLQHSPWVLRAAQARAVAVGAGKQVLGRSAFMKLRRGWFGNGQQV
jgi:peptidoglycan/xylan/chitin deacetylase (PgdA/CDA1 family)